ncbi:MAG TPA: DUF4097 family beta strand repeat-containing protein [Candidatus Acidoferrum sp.]|nr:DUF4097 family beta strand repeat-containing protein [Candidatus Acidoferrum sp.]
MASPMDMIRYGKRNVVIAVAITAAAAMTAGCMSGPDIQGTFNRTFNVNGPVQLEVGTGSGDVHVTVGSSGQVQIHGVIHARGWSDADARDKLNRLESNPPLSQDNNLIRVGGMGTDFNAGRDSIDYTIAVPANTELHCRAGSGGVDVNGIQGPANLSSGSGDVAASGIGSDIQVAAGSGRVKIFGVQGQTQVTTGSGDIAVHDAKGVVRIHSGSGALDVENPSDRVVAETGSGDITVNGATADLRVRTGSGNVTAGGNPGAMNYWDIHASSGDVVLQIPSNASFELHAHTGSGDIDTKIPIVMEGTTNKHELRARIGDGKARVEIQTSSGNITLR